MLPLTSNQTKSVQLQYIIIDPKNRAFHTIIKRFFFKKKKTIQFLTKQKVYKISGGNFKDF